MLRYGYLVVINFSDLGYPDSFQNFEYLFFEILLLEK